MPGRPESPVAACPIAGATRKQKIARAIHNVAISFVLTIFMQASPLNLTMLWPASRKQIVL